MTSAGRPRSARAIAGESHEREALGQGAGDIQARTFLKGQVRCDMLEGAARLPVRRATGMLRA